MCTGKTQGLAVKMRKCGWRLQEKKGISWTKLACFSIFPNPSAYLFCGRRGGAADFLLLSHNGPNLFQFAQCDAEKHWWRIRHARDAEVV